MVSGRIRPNGRQGRGFRLGAPRVARTKVPSRTKAARQTDDSRERPATVSPRMGHRVAERRKLVGGAHTPFDRAESLKWVEGCNTPGPLREQRQGRAPWAIGKGDGAASAVGSDPPTPRSCRGVRSGACAPPGGRPGSYTGVMASAACFDLMPRLRRASSRLHRIKCSGSRPTPLWR